MKKYQLYAVAALMVTALLGVACSSTSNPSSNAPASGTGVASILTVSPSTVTLAAGGSTTITVTGGTSPYTFTAVNNVGSIYQSTANTAVYTAPTSSTMAQVVVTDSAGNSASAYITVGTGSGTTGGLSVTPLAGTVSPGGTLQLTAMGGTAPYYYIVTSANAGSFSSTGLYTAPTTSQTVNVTVYDSAGASVQTTITVGYGGSTGTGGVSACSGTFNWSAGGYSGTMTLVQDTTTGKIAGGMTWNGYSGTDYLSGTCSTTSITFQPQGNGQIWTGTLYTNSSTGQTLWMGSISGATSSWSAVKQ